MAVYAAMVDNMDQNIGRMLDYLKKTGQLDNTFIFFLSDNGADGNSVYDVARTREWIHKDMDNSNAHIGKSGSFAEYGPGWAQVGSHAIPHVQVLHVRGRHRGAGDRLGSGRQAWRGQGRHGARDRHRPDAL
jgi:arylsulfatase A-like enzyme